MNTAFEQYLHRQGFRLNTIRGYLRYTRAFCHWCKQQGTEAEKIDYAGLVAYIKACRPTCTLHTIRGQLGGLRHYFNYLVAGGVREDNPVAALRLRGVTHPGPPDVLKWPELEALYQHYPATGLTAKRNKVMLGLLIYQGLNTAELALLETTDLRLAEGVVYVPATGRSNSRILRLEAHQVVQLQNYVLTLRPALLALAGKQVSRLFFSSGQGTLLHNTFHRLRTGIQRVCPACKGLSHVRASVLTHWLSCLPLRQVQYQAGHRYVSSTERYSTDKLEGLQEQLDNLHPLAGSQEET
jgi:integrase/recombinase XerD